MKSTKPFPCRHTYVAQKLWRPWVKATFKLAFNRKCASLQENGHLSKNVEMIYLTVLEWDLHSCSVMTAQSVRDQEFHSPKQRKAL